MNEKSRKGWGDSAVGLRGEGLCPLGIRPQLSGHVEGSPGALGLKPLASSRATGQAGVWGGRQGLSLNGSCVPVCLGHS